MIYWDREEVTFRIRRLYETGRDISYSGVLDDYPRLLYAAVNYFTNWGEAVTAAGIDYRKVRRQNVWSRRRVKERLMKFRKEGEALSYNRFQKKHPKLFHAALYYFGSWEKALAVVGVDYGKVREAEIWTKEKITKAIRELAERGEDLSYRQMYRSGNGKVASAAIYFFGSWEESINKAGLDYGRIRKRRKPRKSIAGA